MKILVTGASGYIGNELAHTLAAQGNQVHAFVRSDAKNKWLQHPNITLFKGDMLYKESLVPAMRGCKQVYHTAAKVGAWSKVPALFYDVNVEGTRNVLEAATQTNVEKVVFTSTCSVMGPTANKPRKEEDTQNTGFAIDYDRSKKMAEDLVFRYARQGMHAVVVSPSKVYGPGNVSHSLSANAVINIFLRKGIGFIPAPGTYHLCFAYINDVIQGHLLAMEKGVLGEKYILGGVNISYYEFFDRIRTLSRCNGHIIQLPKAVIKAWAGVQELNHKVTGGNIRFTIKAVNQLFNNYTFSSEKAIMQLGYTITPLQEALEKTILFLKRRI